MSLEELFRFPASRLSRRIALWVFFSVILIEALIFIPSYKNREKELLFQLKSISVARVALIMEIVAPDASDDELFEHIKKLENDKVVIGGVLYGADGRKIGEFGEMPELMIANVNPAGMTFLLNRDGSRYDIACSPVELQRDYRLILRHDSTSINDSLFAFFLRVAGLVVIISLVVTVGTWLTLRWIVVNPILNLRQDLVRAGEALSRDQQTPEFYSATVQRNDELGEVIGAFRQMYRQISDAINERKQAEGALQVSFEQVEAYSQKLNNELEKGRHMQINFLPDQLLQLPGWETAAYFKPARQVAGDFYDVFQLPGGSIGFVIADVCDKGVGAALFMALFRSLIRIFSGQTSLDGLPLTCSDALLDDMNDYANNPSVDPTHITALKAINLTNDYIALNHGDLAMFATLFFGVLDPESGSLSYINGGHEPIFIIGPGGGIKERLATTGPAVGVEPKINFEIQQSRLDPGDILLGYTDGVIEASASDGGFFTMDRLEAILEAPASSAADLLDRIANGLQDHIGEADQYDDVTLLSIRRIP
ncbi:MAG: SpoIIE family protein phosphatase [Deltaproteobacteria bacterium]|nr:SpoIIE family protein phosphatase [Deltaproteobacteria bacterium]